MKYSIVIPTYNHCDDLLKPCIESIFKNSHIKDVELIVSANGCFDNTKEYLDQLKETFDFLGLKDHLKIIWNDKPLGYAKACNVGIKQASCNKIVLYSNDVIVLDYWEKGKWLEVLEAPFTKDPTVGVTGSLLKYSPITKSKFAIFFCVMIDKKVFDKIGLISEDYGVGGHEDTDFCHVAEQAGYKIVGVDENKTWSHEINMHVGQFPIYHKGEGTVHDTSLVPEWTKIFYENELTLAKKFNKEWYEEKMQQLSKPEKLDISFLHEYDYAMYDEVIVQNIYKIDEKLIKDKCVIDIGANNGIFSIFAHSLGAKKVLAVEPVGSTYQQLEQNVKRINSNNIILYKNAMSSKDVKSVKIGITDYHGVNSVYTETQTFEEVPTISLASLLKECSGNNVILKIDVEGSEYDILMDATNEEMDRVEKILIEIHADVHPKYKGYEVLHNKLKSFNFTQEHSIPMYYWESNDKGEKFNYRQLPVSVEIWKKETKKSNKEILCNINTKGRYDSTLWLTISAVINQTKKIDHLVIYDDTEEDKAQDLRQNQTYNYLFNMLAYKGITWEYIYSYRKGTHHSHQMANTKGYKWVWRVDDDCIPEPHVLETLYAYTNDGVGGVAGSILTPPFAPVVGSTGKIEDIHEPSIQWDYIKEAKEVDHLHCSFLYRAGIHDYHLGLSKVAFREETLFTYGLKQKGYRLFVVPNAVTWHLKNKDGGVRTETYQLFEHDEQIFQNMLGLESKTVVVLNCGMGDHIVFKNMMHEIKNPIIYSCYPEIVPGKSIAEAMQTLGNIEPYSIYAKMDQWNWTGSLEDAFRKLYVK